MSTIIAQAREVIRKHQNTEYGPAAVDLIADGTIDERDAGTITAMTDAHVLDAIYGLFVLASRLEDEGVSTAFLIRVEHLAVALVKADQQQVTL